MIINQYNIVSVAFKEYPLRTYLRFTPLSWYASDTANSFTLVEGADDLESLYQKRLKTNA